MCNTNSSHGYVYIRVGIRKLDQLPVKKELEDVKDGECIWSASLLPRIGEAVEMDGNRGKGIVCSYFVEHKHLHCMVQGGHKRQPIWPLPSFEELKTTWFAFQACKENVDYPEDGMEWVKKEFRLEGDPAKVLLPNPWYSDHPCAAGQYSPIDFIDVTNIMGREWQPIQKKEIA